MRMLEGGRCASLRLGITTARRLNMGNAFQCKTLQKHRRDWPLDVLIAHQTVP